MGAGRFVVIVLDGFGVGAMDDVTIVRPSDKGSNTALHIIEEKPYIQIPNLLELGLMNSIGVETKNQLFSKKANWGLANLAHQGADSFLGHQEIMGTAPPIPLNQPFNEVIDKVEKDLIENGYAVRRVNIKNGFQILVVNESAIVGDNLETDLGQVFNVSACLDLMSFKDLRELGQCVRDAVKVSRVIAFGGKGINLSNLLDACKSKKDVFVGIDAPKSGVYETGYQVIHFGYGINKDVQIPTILDRAHIPVILAGKVADIVQTESQALYPGVDSNYLFDQFIKVIKMIDVGFFCLNIQETDLAGHAEDVDRYADRLEISDFRIGELISLLNEDDILVVTADHGNDPTVGHSQHTREKVPLLIYKKGLSEKNIGKRGSMSDTAATIADYFGVETPQNGESYLPLLH